MTRQRVEAEVERLHDQMDSQDLHSWVPSSPQVFVSCMEGWTGKKYERNAEEETTKTVQMNPPVISQSKIFPYICHDWLCTELHISTPFSDTEFFPLSLWYDVVCLQLLCMQYFLERSLYSFDYIDSDFLSMIVPSTRFRATFLRADKETERNSG